MALKADDQTGINYIAARTITVTVEPKLLIVRDYNYRTAEVDCMILVADVQESPKTVASKL